MPSSWVERLAIRDLRNVREATVELHPGINVFHGRNAQGKTSVLEALGVVARGRSFRTDDAASMIRRGAHGLVAEARHQGGGRRERLEVELRPGARIYRLDGRAVGPSEYGGRLEVAVYSSDRLRVARGSMRDRRQYLDRQAGALWPAYRAELRRFERLLTQRNAALERRSRDIDAWSERFVESAARIRQRRAHYAERLTAALRGGFRPVAEEYAVRVHPAATTEDETREQLALEIQHVAAREQAAGRTLAGPQRDQVALLLDGRDVAEGASSGQVRSMLLALTLAVVSVYHDETGRSAIALLDDLDSELDEERAGAVCEEVTRRGQALVTSAHPGWAESLRPLGRVYHVAEGQVHQA